jgi:hypothetical protein
MQKIKLDILIDRRDKLLENTKPLIKEQKHLDSGTEVGGGGSKFIPK